MDRVTLGQYRGYVRSHDWEAVYRELYPDYDPQDEEYFDRCTEQDYYDGPDAWAFDDIKEESVNPEDYECSCNTVATPERFVLEITLGNAAMSSEEDVADALREVANLLYRGQSSGIYDLNGNKVGHYRFETGE